MKTARPPGERSEHDRGRPWQRRVETVVLQQWSSSFRLGVQTHRGGLGGMATLSGVSAENIR